VVTLAALHVYPVKSCRGLAPAEARLTDAGLEHDREWLIVTPGGRFLTQREEPRLATVEVALGDGALTLSAAGAGSVAVPLEPAAGPRREVTVWDHRCEALDQGEDAAAWLGDLLGRPLRLVRFDPAHRRASSREWTGGVEAWTRFSDGFALLAISTASLEDLNARLSRPLPRDRFRANLWLDGLPAYGEDALRDLVAGGARLRRAKPCARCIVTTTDQARGARDGEEPIRTLEGYRWDAALRGVTFGQNLIVVGGHGEWLRVGMELQESPGPARD
jgi:uncharacterized protein YcbX